MKGSHYLRYALGIALIVEAIVVPGEPAAARIAAFAAGFGLLVWGLVAGVRAGAVGEKGDSLSGIEGGGGGVGGI